MANQSASNGFRFSVRTLISIVAVVAVACAALAYPSRWWEAFFFSFTVFMLATALVAAIFCRGPARAFWAGFALFGCVYMFLQFVGLPIRFFEDDMLLPNMLLEFVQQWVRRNSYFEQVWRCLSVLIVGIFGGVVGLFCYRQRTA